ncbi:hypothetical protein SAMN02745163_03562 [Clostridium cavendishii DSM 21758]|uniref:Uncharacterized protein n=1 Tax=Clostridium cavendishii DSM 21758 TaxID=1121302 RepID=A0A1M6R7D6_9CLOT|nr:hypothetical protein [Clostridium cavendishii]SHK28364.1 hypothetical protein SAMN02745163_03562 [Clostridium cavendishii DSM 21758]
MKKAAYQIGYLGAKLQLLRDLYLFFLNYAYQTEDKTKCFYMVVFDLLIFLLLKILDFDKKKSCMILFSFSILALFIVELINSISFNTISLIEVLKKSVEYTRDGAFWVPLMLILISSIIFFFNTKDENIVQLN